MVKTFWNNEGLRGSLFPGRIYPIQRNEAIGDFVLLVSQILDVNNPLYKFIEVK